VRVNDVTVITVNLKIRPEPDLSLQIGQNPAPARL